MFQLAILTFWQLADAESFETSTSNKKKYFQNDLDFLKRYKNLLKWYTRFGSIVNMATDINESGNSLSAFFCFHN
jgi:hypothetical protein